MGHAGIPDEAGQVRQDGEYLVTLELGDIAPGKGWSLFLNVPAGNVVEVAA